MCREQNRVVLQRPTENFTHKCASLFTYPWLQHMLVNPFFFFIYIYGGLIGQAVELLAQVLKFLGWIFHSGCLVFRVYLIKADLRPYEYRLKSPWLRRIRSVAPESFCPKSSKIKKEMGQKNFWATDCLVGWGNKIAFALCVWGVVVQSVERATPGEEVLGSIPAVAAQSLLGGSVSV